MKIKNVAIIAHVDHGKTTLVDALLRQSNTHLNKDLTDTKQILDSNELERERGITIFSKNASIIYKDTKINIIDTPGHADFGGEVERVLSMADGALLLVDAKEGPMPQTRFVLKQALKMGLKIIVVVNKIDKKDARPSYVVNKTFDLFIELGASEDTAYFPVLYASGRDGKAGYEPDLAVLQDIAPVFEEILKYVPDPKANSDKPLQMRVSTLGRDDYKGRIAIGKIYSGKIVDGQNVAHINRGGEIKICRITSIATFTGLEKEYVKEASAGDIVAVSGITDVTIGETIYEGWIKDQGSKDVLSGEVTKMERVKIEKTGSSKDVDLITIQPGYLTGYEIVEISDGVETMDLLFFKMRYFLDNGKILNLDFSADKINLEKRGLPNLNETLGKLMYVRVTMPGGDSYLEKTVELATSYNKFNKLQKEFFIFTDTGWVKAEELLNELNNPSVEWMNLMFKLRVDLIAL